MHELFDFMLNLVSQFAGGPGPPENNFVRFGLAAILWGVLLSTAWNRSRHQTHVRERLLVAGFGLSLFRELFKLSYLLYKMYTGTAHSPLCAVMVPTEHALTLASVVLITAAYLRYILDDPLLAKRYLIVGGGTVLMVTVTSAVWWPQYLLTTADAHFHETWIASAIHMIGALLVVPGIFIMIRHQGWMRNVIACAFTLLFASELAVFINFVTERAFAAWLCPMGNAVYLIAIPLFGYVYHFEQQNEQLRAEAALRSYRDHLEELVEARTREITQANHQLQEEIGERERAQAELLRRNSALAAQNEIAATISHAVNLGAVLDTVVTLALDLTGMNSGSVFLQDPQTGKLTPANYHSRLPHLASGSGFPTSLAVAISEQVASTMMPAAYTVAEPSSSDCDGKSPTPPASRYISVPLISQDHAVGVLTLSAGDVDVPDPDVLDFLTAIGQQVGVAVEKTRLQQRLELAAVQDERQRIAAEFHDGLAQTLSYMGLKADTAAKLLAKGHGDEAAAVLRHIQDALGQATYEVRRSIASFQEDPSTSMSLQEAVEQVVNVLRTESDPQVVMENQLSAPVYYDRETTEQIVRVIQEALNNALHHAAARTIHVRLTAGNDMLIAIIEDDGHGFSVEDMDSSEGVHFGLSIMHARAANVGGELYVDSHIGAGTEVRLLVPLPETEFRAAHFIVR